MRYPLLLSLLVLGLGTVFLAWGDDETPKSEKDAVPAAERERADAPREARDGERAAPRREEDRPPPRREEDRPPPRRDGERPEGDRPGDRPRILGERDEGRGPPPRHPEGQFPAEGDHEMQELMHKDMLLERESMELARRYRMVAGEQREEVIQRLRKVTEDHFAARQSRRELQIKRMEFEVNRMKEETAARKEARDAILRRRLQELLGEEGALSF